MRARDKYDYDGTFGDFVYRSGCRMARVRDEVLKVPMTVAVTFYANYGGIWLIDHEEEGFEFAHEAFERGAEWVEEGSAA